MNGHQSGVVRMRQRASFPYEEEGAQGYSSMAARKRLAHWSVVDTEPRTRFTLRSFSVSHSWARS